MKLNYLKYWKYLTILVYFLNKTDVSKFKNIWMDTYTLSNVYFSNF